MSDDKERLKQTVIKQPSAETDDSGDGPTAAPMQSPFFEAADGSDGPTAAPMRSPFYEANAPYSKTAHRDPVIGTSVSGYLVKGRLGSGGMGIVYEGEQQTIGKRVAIKVLRPEVAENPDVVERLVAEARAVNQVGHRGIIDVFAFGELPDGRQCIVMEYLDGESLDAILSLYVREKRVMPVGDVLIILDEILSALSAAHAAGVIHRDLKPSNIFLCKQRDGARYVKLLDFGIAKLGVLGNATPQSRASLMMGTPSYMSPEQAKGGNIGPAMDLYAVGVMAFEMFTGRLPFLADSVVAMLMSHQSDVPPAPSSVNLTLPDGVDEMVLKLLEKKPEDRFQNADAVRQVVVKLRKELADPTSKRMQLEVTISARDKADAVASNAARVSQKVPVHVPAVTMAPLPAPAPTPALMQTSVTPKRAPVVQAPEQVAATHEDLHLDAPPRSNRGPILGLVAVVVVLLVGIFALTRNPVAPAEPAEVAKVDPPPVVKQEPVKVEPPPVVKEEPVKVEPPPVAKVEPVKVEPPVVKEEPVVAKVEPPPPAKEAPKVVAKVEPPPPVKEAPKVVAKVEPPPAVKLEPKPVKVTAAKGSTLGPRLKKLEARLEKASAGGANVELYLKQVTKIQARLADAALTDDERDRLESAVARLEQSTDF